jgi:steroid delta-isomerase-like uncharacterized protein
VSRREIILNAWNKAWGGGDAAAFEQLLTPDYIRRSKSGTEDFHSVERTITATHTAFPDLTCDILHFLEEGDSAAIRWQTKGTHQGEFMDVPATGRSVSITGASFLRFEGDKLAEEWVVSDPRELLAAIGIWHLGSGNA